MFREICQLIGRLGVWVFLTRLDCLILHPIYYLPCYQTWQTAKHTIQDTAKLELHFKVKSNVTKT